MLITADLNIKKFPDDHNIHNNYISIGIHNVRDFNVISKQRVFFDEYTDLNLDIIGLTETKLANKLSKFTQQNNKIYKSWWTGIEDQNKTGGIGIAIKFGLHKHVIRIITKLGRLISMNLMFKEKITIRIINIRK